MLGFLTIPHQWRIPPSLSFLSAISSPSSFSLPLNKFPLHYSYSSSQSQISSNPRRFTAFASNKNNELGGNIKEREGEGNGTKGSSNGGDDLRKERGPVFNIKWAELLIDPDPDNILAVALTGLLAWASVQVSTKQHHISSSRLHIIIVALQMCRDRYVNFFIRKLGVGRQLCGAILPIFPQI
ncbi:uncharacterized protein LOC120081233 [Benincasa hispida]|uniref:uncharacterized protein LOC120081233 n=1 Tax=Benincasa hispida TaxID=102211 RepID=UPI0019014EB5|nr:uncharacterized protein LOC120081233 [Benincasa hispida]